MPVLIAMGVGAVVNDVSAQQKFQNQKKNAAITQRYSPWTGMKADTPTDPGLLGPAVQGAGQGAAMAQGIQQQAQGIQQQGLVNQWLKQGYSPYAAGAFGGAASNPTEAASYKAMGANTGDQGTLNFGTTAAGDPTGSPIGYNSSLGQIGQAAPMANQQMAQNPRALNFGIPSNINSPNGYIPGPMSSVPPNYASPYDPNRTGYFSENVWGN